MDPEGFVDSQLRSGGAASVAPRPTLHVQAALLFRSFCSTAVPAKKPGFLPAKEVVGVGEHQIAEVRLRERLAL